MDNILNIQTLWEGFDVNAEPLDVEVLSQTTDNHVTVKRLYFTGRSLPKGKSRVFGAVYCKGSFQDKPAVLVIGDFDKPIYGKVLEDFARRGFVAMSIDMAGRREDGLFTLYPDELNYCNSDSKRTIFEITSTARETRQYEYAVNCRRAISYLLNEEKVSCVSVVTLGRGVYVGMIVLGVDSRVKNGAILFGNIYRAFPAPNQTELMDAAKEELDRRIAYDVRRQMWEIALAPQTYAMQIKAPVYVVNSANSAHVDVVDNSKTFVRFNEKSRLLVLPTTLDYIPSTYADGVVRWLSGYQAPMKSELKSFLDDKGDYCLRVVTDHPFERTSLWYCTAANNKAKHWIRAELTKTDNGYVAKPVLYDKQCTLAAFAAFEDEISTTTPLHLENVRANSLKKALNIIFSGTGKQALVPLSGNDEMWNVDLEPKLTKGDLGIMGAKGKSLGTFALTETSIRVNPILTLCFDVCCKVKQRLKITGVVSFGDRNEAYSQEVEILGNGKWERLTIEKIDFHRVGDGKQLAETERLDMLAFSADNEFILNNIFLV
ncbi:MAG: hypothetical protein J1F65_03980 [Clostridiales bacterium]|nr:hypothetical protein [Clostridiales bacterium]